VTLAVTANEEVGWIAQPLAVAVAVAVAGLLVGVEPPPPQAESTTHKVTRETSAQERSSACASRHAIE
jgi:hypothetical protein